MKAKRKKLPKISIICAIGKNLAIGKNNKLLWHLPEDMKHFQQITKGHAIIMGRKTYESIGRPLSDRINIVVTSKPDFKPEGCIIVSSIDEALKAARSKEKDEIFIIGGGEIYKQTISLTDKLYLTIVDDVPSADTFFPDYSDFKKVILKEENQNENYHFTYLDLER